MTSVVKVGECWTAGLAAASRCSGVRLLAGLHFGTPHRPQTADHHHHNHLQLSHQYNTHRSYRTHTHLQMQMHSTKQTHRALKASQMSGFLLDFVDCLDHVVAT